MNGVELAGELRARFADVPIVFLTGSRLEPWRAQLEQIGPRFVLRKPAAMADLLRVIADVCRPSSSGTDA
jgi:CheY-like chemotaxis protein